MQLIKIIAVLVYTIYFSTCFGENRYNLSNKIKNGLVETKPLFIYDEQYLNSQDELIGIDSNLFSLIEIQNDWKTVLDRYSCSDEQFEQSFDYIKYLFFLSRISINYEILLSYQQNLLKVDNKCPINFSELIENCKPESPDMKKFISRLKRYANGGNEEEKIKTLKFDLGLNLNQTENEEINSPLGIELKQICTKNSDCLSMGEKKFEYIKSSCEVRKQQFLKSCNENEREFNQLVSLEMVNLIKRSSAIDYIKKFGASPSCVDRFFRDVIKEPADDDLSIRTVMRSNVNLDIPYLQGRIFVIGSLKIFDDLGVGNDIFQEIKVGKIEVILPEVKKVEEIIKKPEVERIAMIQEVIVQKKVVEQIKPRLSALMLAAEDLEKSKSINKVSLDMELFKNDYIFSDEVLTKLHKPLGFYQKRNSLKEMKEFDKLGEKVAPMRLLFIKYLIDNNYHQGLFNVQAVLGTQFYVKNDLVKSDPKLYKIEIQNDESTNNAWQLYLIRD